MKSSTSPEGQFAKLVEDFFLERLIRQRKFESANCRGLSRLFPAAVRVCSRPAEQTSRPFGAG